MTHDRNTIENSKSAISTHVTVPQDQQIQIIRPHKASIPGMI